MKNKLLASILTACMLLTMLPTAAFAAEAEAESGTEQTAAATEQSDSVAEDAVTQPEGNADGADAGDAADATSLPQAVEGVITLTNDVTLADQWTIAAGETVELDLHGYTLTTKNPIVVSGTLTVKDSTAGDIQFNEQDHTVTYNAGKILNNCGIKDSNAIAVKVEDGGTFVHDSGTIESKKNYTIKVYGDTTINGGYEVGPEGGPGVFGSAATLTVSGGVILGTDNSAVAGNGDGTSGGTTINITGGTLVGKITSSGYAASGIYHPQSGTLNISGGTIYADNGVGVLMRAGTANITGGEIIASGTTSGWVGDNKNQVPPSGVVYDVKANYPDLTDGTNVINIGGNAVVTAEGSDQKAVSILSDNEQDKKDYFEITGGTFGDVSCLEYLAGNANVDVVLDKDVTADVTIPADTTVTLDLNGHKLTNKSNHTIVNNGTLTIKDSVGGGTVDNVTHARGALVNYGNVTLESGTLTRSQEAGSSPTESGGNSWYVVDNNKGTMTVKGGEIVSTGKFSSLIHNIGDGSTRAQLTIEGGELSNGFIAVKNDEYGDLKISGGNITSDDQAVQNWSQAELSGGTMNGAVYTWAADDFAGEMTISGDTKINGNVYSVQYVYSDETGAEHQPTASAETKVEGGTIVGNVGAAFRGGTPNTLGTVVVSGGNFSVPVKEKYLAENLKAELQKPDGEAPYSYYPTTEEAQKHASAGDTVTDLRVPKEPGKTYYDVTLDYADGVSANLKTPVEKDTTYIVPSDPSRSGYDFLHWISDSNDSNDSNDSGPYYYAGNKIQVTGNITLTAKWEKQNDNSSSGSSDNERTYAIVTEDDGHGSVTVSADEASAGTRITVTVKPDAGYELDELTVTDAKNKDLKVTKRSETTYTFHMADSKVTVEASFTKDGTVQKPDTRFDDVAKSAWYYKAVEYVAENGIMSGVSAREFAPNAGFSRAMLAQTLYAMSGKPTVKAEGTFADVAANAWYADAVNWAAEKGYVSGVGDGKFAPDASITREQMALILYRYAGSPDASGMVLREFADGDSVSAYAVDAIRWAVHEGLISGMENNTLAPQGTATRAQVAQILMNFHQKLDK